MTPTRVERLELAGWLAGWLALRVRDAISSLFGVKRIGGFSGTRSVASLL